MSPSTSRAGYTLAELLVVLLIVGILASLCLKAGSSARAREATVGDAGAADLQVILSAENRYKLENGGYRSGFDTASLNKDLGIALRDTHFTYRVQSNNPREFTAVAVRTGGSSCRGQRMSITQTGLFTKECKLWR